MVDRGVVGEFAGGDFDRDSVAFENAHHAIVFDDADFGVGEIPFLEDFADAGFLAFVDDDEHAFLGFGEENFVGGHARFAFGHEVEIDLDAGAAAARGFAG